MLNIKKNQKGFTLIELILVIGLIALTTISIYTYYKKKSMESQVNTLTNYLRVIDQDINDAFLTSNDFSVLTPSFAISSNLVPSQIVNGSQISDNFGGYITFSTVTISGTAGYSIILSGVSQDACTLLATTDFAGSVQQVSVNGSMVKPAASPNTPVTIAASAGACTSTTNNTIKFDNLPIRITPFATPSTTPVRAKESAYYMPTIDSAPTSPTVSCTGGSTWNGSFCGCPSGSNWNGATCSVYGSSPGNCAFGQGWSQTTGSCQTLPSTSATNTHLYSANVASVSPTSITGAVASTTPAYISNRNVPESYTSAIVQTSAGNSCTSPGTVPVASGVPSTIPTTVTAGHYDTQACETCPNGDWDGYRCVTPAE